MTCPPVDAADPVPQMRVECGRCEAQLPLRLGHEGERAAVWLCACCSVPFAALCLEDRLPDGASTVRLDARYFDIGALPAVSPRLLQQIAKMAAGPPDAKVHEKRRSRRVAQSLVVPAIQLDSTYTPTGFPFQLMVANLSREGIGLVHKGPIDAEQIALELSPDLVEPIQVIVRLVRQQPLTPPFCEIGGEFFVRLGSRPEDES